MSQYIPPLTWFRAFDSAARHLSFTKAALELNLTQSAISQHVRALETKFGCQLFVRKPRGLALTDHGRRLLPSVTRAISALSTAAATLETSGERQVLTIAASDSISRPFITPFLASFMDQNPGIGVRLAAKTWPDEFSGLDADVEIRFDSAQQGNKSATLLTPNNMVVVASPQLKNPSEIAAHRLIQVIGTADSWQLWAEAQNLDQPLDIAAYVESHAAAVDLAETGFGLAFTHRLAATCSLKNGSLVEVNHPSLAAHDGYYVALRQGENLKLAQKFVAWLQGNIASMQ